MPPTVAADIKITNCELVPGLEPDNADDIATAVYCSFEVSSRTLARALGAQLRTLGRRVEKMNPEHVLNAVKRSDEVVDALEAAAKRAVRIFVAHELMETPPRSGELEVDFSEAEDWSPVVNIATDLEGSPYLVVQDLELNVVKV